MRNLKRALSLALASVMVMGMMVVGTSASYKDVDASDNQEAIEVLQAVKIMVGDDNGNFNPDANVTRNEMAVIMSNLLNLDYDYYRGINPFTDVPSWAAPYVAACAAEGVTSGIGNGLYGGNNTVTAAQAALMVMKALGYFQYSADFGDDWQVATVRQASYIDLFDQINANAETPLTRGQVAQMVLNGLKANMVEFTGDVGSKVTINGAEINVGYKAEYTAKTNAAKKYDSIDTGITNIGKDDKYYVQLGEELYNGDLKLKADTDAFGRPGNTWTYKNEQVGTYVDYTLLVAEYTTSVSGKELYDVVGKTAYDKYDFESYVDGKDADLHKEISKNNKDDVSNTADGALTQVFVDTEAEEAVVTVINTYLVKADADYNSKKDSASFIVYGLSGKSRVTIDNDDFYVEDVDKDDFALITYSYDEEEVQSLTDVEVLSDVEISKFSTSKGTVTAVTVDGTKYNDSAKLAYDTDVLNSYTNTNLKETTYNVYLDQYGYVIGVEEADGIDNYVFITGTDASSSNLSTKNYEANAIFLDGTSKVIKVKNNDDTPADGPLTNSWYKYTVSKDDVYTLTAITRNQITFDDNGDVGQYRTTAAELNAMVSGSYNKAEINDKHIALKAAGDKRVYANDDTVYLLAELDKITSSYSGSAVDYAVIKGVDEVVVGIDNADFTVWTTREVSNDTGVTNQSNTNLSYGVYALYDDDAYVIAAVVVGDSGSVSEKIAFNHKNKLEDEAYDKVSEEWTWTEKVIINGQEVLLTEIGDDNDSELEQKMTGTPFTGVKYGWYTIKYDANGNVKSVAPYNDAAKYFNTIAAAVNAIAKDDEDTIVVDLPVTTDDLELVGKTLWNQTTDEEGFRVASDVNVVLIQTVKNKETTTYETGSDALKSILSDLNDINGHKYTLDAVIENGRATSVIIVDKNEDGTTVIGPSGSTTGTVKTVTLTSAGGVSLVDKNGNAIAGTGLSWALYMRSASQETFNVALKGNDIAAEYTQLAGAMSGKTGYTFYLVVDGVESNYVLI